MSTKRIAVAMMVAVGMALAGCDVAGLVGALVPGQPDASTGSAGTPVPAGNIPPEVFEACEALTEGDACTAVAFGTSLPGTCSTVDDGQLACLPEVAPGGGRGGAFPGGFGGPGGFFPGGDGTPSGGELLDTFVVIDGPRATEDLTFDDQGHLIGAQDGNIFRTSFDGTPEIIVANAAAGGGGFLGITGILVLPDGDILYCDGGSGTLFRVDASGAKTAVLSGMAYPNGMEAGLDGFVFVAETQADRIRRINPDTGDFTILTSEVSGPDGVTFSPAYDVLYISSSDSGNLYALEMNPDGQPGELRVFASDLGFQLNDMVVDVNGNIYLVKAIDGELWRFSPDGQTQTMLLKVNDLLASVEWGSGVGGWDAQSLYMTNRSNNDFVYSVRVGVSGKPR